MPLPARLLLLLGTAWRRPRIAPLDEAVLRFRVLPTDLDVNLHMNNARYLALMDLGRADLMLRLGVLWETLRRRWGPVLASVAITFRRPLDPMQRFTLHTRIVAWDERWIFLEQRFERAGDTVARAFVKSTFVAPAGRVPTSRVMALVGTDLAAPPMPEPLRAWVEAQEIRAP